MAEQHYVNKWEDLGWRGHNGHPCTTWPEYCTGCGRQLEEIVDPTGRYSTRTGEPTATRRHMCPTLVRERGWRPFLSAILRVFTSDFSEHTDHDADNRLG